LSRCRRRGKTDAALTDMRMEDSAAISTGPREAHAIGKKFSHVWRPYADWRAACAFRRYAYLARFRPRALERPDRGPGGRATTAGVYRRCIVGVGRAKRGRTETSGDSP